MSENNCSSIWLRLFLYLLIIDLIVCLMAIGGRMLLDWPPLTAFHLFFYGAQIALGLALIGLVQLLYGLFRKQQPHLTTGVLTLVLGLLPLAAAVVSVGVDGFRAPMIHDISTDLVDPPVFSIINSLRTAEDNSIDYAGESVAREQRQAFPDIQTHISSMAPAQAHAKALHTIARLGWVLVVDDESTGNIEAYDQSRVFGFIDDVVIRILPGGSGSRIDVRSVSRVGLGDLGANAGRVRQFFSAYAE